MSNAPVHPPAASCVVQALRFAAMARSAPATAPRLKRLALLCERLAYGRVRGRRRTLLAPCSRCESKERKDGHALCRGCIKYMRETSAARHATSEARA